MTDARLRTASATLALFGIALATYLLYVRETGSTLTCISGGCEAVQSSPYAVVLGVPVALLGLVGYLGILAAGIARGQLASLGQAVLALAAFGYGTYLLYIQIHVLDALCVWCLANDSLVTALAFVSIARLASQAGS
ncbi:MAG TPA: vitamin K epoxide reductase family protein [Gaiellaceae bacterium]